MAAATNAQVPPPADTFGCTLLIQTLPHFSPAVNPSWTMRAPVHQLLRRKRGPKDPESPIAQTFPGIAHACSSQRNYAADE